MRTGGRGQRERVLAAGSGASCPSKARQHRCAARHCDPPWQAGEIMCHGRRTMTRSRRATDVSSALQFKKVAARLDRSTSSGSLARVG